MDDPNMTLLEELYFRITNGLHFDWEEEKQKLTRKKGTQ